MCTLTVGDDSNVSNLFIFRIILLFIDYLYLLLFIHIYYHNTAPDA
jgi:hypothetical protein